MTSELAFRIGAGALALAALGFGIPAVIGAAHFLRTGSVWRLWGYPTYGPGLFGRWGAWAAPAALMSAFAVVCALTLVAAVLLWIPPVAMIGAVAGLVLIAGQAVFWLGFQLPFGPPLGVLAGTAIVVGILLAATSPAGWPR